MVVQWQITHLLVDCLGSGADGTQRCASPRAIEFVRLSDGCAMGSSAGFSPADGRLLLIDCIPCHNSLGSILLSP